MFFSQMMIMKYDLEKYLWDEMEKNGHGYPFPRDVINHMINNDMIKSAKQAWWTLEKWSEKGCYDWGCKLDLGWKKGISPFRVNDE